MEYSEGRPLRIGGAAQRAEVELLDLVDGTAAGEDRLSGALEIGHRVTAEQGGWPVDGVDADVLLGVGHLVGIRVVGPAKHVAVEGGGALGVRRPHRYIPDVAMLNGNGGAGDRPAEHPPVPGRVDDGGASGSVVLVRLPLHDGATLPRPVQGRVGVGHLQHEAHRTRLWRRRFQAELWVLVGQVQHAVADREFGVADAAVVHLVHLADDGCAEHVDVPGDRLPRIGDRQVGQCRGPWGRGGHLGLDGGLVQFGDGGVGAAHDNSFGSIRQGQHRFQACAQRGRERRIGLDRKLVAMQHGQWIVAVVHDNPPSGSG